MSDDIESLKRKYFQLFWVRPGSKLFLVGTMAGSDDLI